MIAPYLTVSGTGSEGGGSLGGAVGAGAGFGCAAPAGREDACGRAASCGSAISPIGKLSVVLQNITRSDELGSRC